MQGGGAGGAADAETRGATYPNVPASAEFGLYWGHKSPALVRTGKARRFGFITTNSLRQTFIRRVLQPHLAGEPPLSLRFAIPDHPWVDTADGAAVRISMTVGQAGEAAGRLLTVIAERGTETDTPEVTLTERNGRIQSDLTIGADIATAKPLLANLHLSSRGVQLIGAGFIVAPEQAQQLGLGRVPGIERHIRLYRNGRDLTATPRDVMVIDLLSLIHISEPTRPY